MLTGDIDTVVDGLVIIDHEGRIKAFNPACEQIFGCSAAEAMNRNARVLMPPPYHDEHDAYLRQYRETGRRKITDVGREVQGRRKDGSVFRWILPSARRRAGKSWPSSA